MINLTLGSITPPFGYTLFALKGAAGKMTTGEVFAASWPVVGIFIAGMAILWAVPSLVTTIPSLLQ